MDDSGDLTMDENLSAMCRFLETEEGLVQRFLIDSFSGLHACLSVCWLIGQRIRAYIKLSVRRHFEPLVPR